MTAFGWDDADTPVVGDSERSKLQAAEELTDDLVLPAYAVLDDRGQAALVAGLESIGKALGSA
jgi:hypothetical protein